MTDDQSRHARLKSLAARYGELGLENYARVRALGQRIASGFCDYLDSGNPPCVFLVPPKGPFQPRDYGGAAFTISGRGFLPIAPIGFGLAVRVSDQADFLRLTLSVAKEGEEMVVRIKNGGAYEFHSGEESEYTDFYEHLYQHLVSWYEERIQRYEVGDYGATSIGFEMVRLGEPAVEEPLPEEAESAPAVSDY